MVGAEGGDGAVVLAGASKFGGFRRLLEIDGLAPDDDAERVVERVEQAAESLGQNPRLLVRPELQVERRHRQQPDTGVTEIDVAVAEALPGLLELAQAVAGLDLALQSPQAPGKRRGAPGWPYQAPRGTDVLEEGTRESVGRQAVLLDERGRDGKPAEHRQDRHDDGNREVEHRGHQPADGRNHREGRTDDQELAGGEPAEEWRRSVCGSGGV